MSTVYRTCLNCGTVNLNRDYCKNCGELINTLVKRKKQREQKAFEKKKQQIEKKPNRITLFFENSKQHDNPIVRFAARFLYSVWIVVIAIGSFLAFLFGYIAA